MSEFLQSYGELSKNLLSAPLRSSTLGRGCFADTSDCSTDTCPSDTICSNDSPPPIYTIRATVNFDANGGSVSPDSAIGEAYAQPKPYGKVSIVFPTPTRNGYIFLYWLLDGYTTHWPAGANDVYATSSGETYTARAQWEKQTAGKAFIGDGGVWKQAVPYIGDGGVWKPATGNIGDGGAWK